MERQQRFSIRKFKTTVGSALLASLMLGAPLLQAGQALAQEQAQAQTPITQASLQNATNLTTPPKEASQLVLAMQEHAGQKSGELTHVVSSPSLAEAVKKAQETGVTVTQADALKYDSLEAALADYENQVLTVEDITEKQIALNQAYQEAVVSYKSYLVALEQYQKDKAAYDAYLVAKSDYDTKFANYQEAYKAYETALAANVKATADYEQKKIAYDKAYSLYQDQLAKYNTATQNNAVKKAAYEKALEQYQKDKAAYDAAIAKYTAAKEADTVAKAKYDKELAQYQKDDAQYQKDLSTYQKQLAEAQKNTGRDGYLSKVAAQNLVFEREPNATVTITGQKAHLDPSVSQTDDRQGLNTDVKRYTPSDYRSTPQLTNYPNVNESYLVLMGYGQTTTVRYDNLQNSSYNGRKIGSVVYKYTPKATYQNGDVVAFLSKDPTKTFVGGSDYQKGQTNEFRMRFDVEFYYENGEKVIFDKNSSALVALTSLNSYDNFSHTEQVTDYSKTAEFIKITGSSIDEVGGVIKPVEDNQPTNKEWDRVDSPTLYYGSGALLIKNGNKISFTFGSNSDARIWFAFNSKIATVGSLPKTPIPPVKPIPPKPTTTGQTPVEPPKVEEPVYETVEKPTPPVEPVKPIITEPVKPTQPTPPQEVPSPGEPDKVPEPKVPELLSVTIHKAIYTTQPAPVKGVTNELSEDVARGLVPKGSTVKFPITLPNLQPERDLTKTFVIEDVIDEGLELDLEAVKVAYPDFEVTYDKDRLLKLTAKESYLAKMNEDLTKAFEFNTPELIAQVLNDGKTYTNTLKVTINDYSAHSETVKFTTPGQPDDPDHPTNNLIEPTKAVTNQAGENINGKDILRSDKVIYPNLWDLDQFATIKNGDKAKQIHIHIEDIDGSKAMPDLDNLKFIDKAGEPVSLKLNTLYIESLDKADDDLKKYLTSSGLADKIEGDFIATIPEDMVAFEEQYVKTGNSINFDLVMTPKKEATGLLKNTSYQISYGNGYKTSTVENTIKTTTEWVDKSTNKPLKDMVTGDKAENRGDFPNYRFVETVTTDTGVKHLFERLYTTEWVDESDKPLKESKTDTKTHDKGEISGMTFVKTVDTKTGIKHIFKPEEKKTPAKNLPSTGDSLGVLSYLGAALLALALAWKLGLIKKIKALMSR